MIQLWTICNFIDVWCIKFVAHQNTFRLSFPPCMHLSGFFCNHNSFYCQAFPSFMLHGPSCKADVHVGLQGEHFTCISAILESKEYIFQIWKWFLTIIGFLYNSKVDKVVLLKGRINIPVLKAKGKFEEQLTKGWEGGPALLAPFEPLESAACLAGAKGWSSRFDLTLMLEHLEEVKDMASENWAVRPMKVSEALGVLPVEFSYIIHGL